MYAIVCMRYGMLINSECIANLFSMVLTVTVMINRNFLGNALAFIIFIIIEFQPCKTFGHNM